MRKATMKKKAKGCLVAAGVLAGILALAALLLAVGYPIYAAHVRREWKEQALPEIARRAADREWIAREIIRLKLAAKAEKPGTFRGENGTGWLSDHIILMQSELPENQPATLAAFAKRYHLREFDGHSDA